MLMFADNYNTNKINKWKNQKYHQKRNKIQRVSKQKYTTKQRKHSTKCKTQKQRKQIYDQLIFELFDYNEYDEYNNEYEYEYNYYSNSQKQNHIIDNEFQYRFDGIDVDVKYYCIDNKLFDNNNNNNNISYIEWPCPQCTLIQSLNNKTCRLCFEPQPKLYKNINLKNKQKKQQEIIKCAGTSLKIYKNNINIETKNREQCMINFNNFNSFFNCETSFKNIEKKLTENIINKSIKTYKGNIKNGNILKLFKGIKTNKIVNNMQICYTYSNENNNQKINLNNILFESIPNLWFIYHYLCQYIGYKYLNIFVYVKAKIRNLNTLRTYNIIKKYETSNSGNGITYYNNNKSQTNIKYSYLYNKSYINNNNNNNKYKRNKSKNTNIDCKLRKLYNELNLLRDKIYSLKLNIFQLQIYKDAQFIPNCLRKNVIFPKWCFQTKHRDYKKEACVYNILRKAYNDSFYALDARLRKKQRELRQTNIKYKDISNEIINHKLSKLTNNKQEFEIRHNFTKKCNFKELICENQLKKEEEKILIKCDKLFNKIHLKIKNDEYIKLLQESKTNENLLFKQENNKRNDNNKNESDEIEDEIYSIFNDIYDDYYGEINNDLSSEKYAYLANVGGVNLDEKIRIKIVNKYGNDIDKKRLKYRNKAIRNYKNMTKNIKYIN